MREDVQKWLRIAKRDLNSATYAVEFMDYSLTAFLCQQSVEKGLKAVYIKKFNDLKKTHDLFFLGRKVELPKKLLSICEELNSFYFITRYPDVSDEECSKEDAVHAIKNAREVLNWIEKNM